MSLVQKIRGAYIHCQQELFSWLETRLGALPKQYEKLVRVLEMVRVEDYLPQKTVGRVGGRPPSNRANLARAFLAKMVFNIQTTVSLRERLLSDEILRSLCGWGSDLEVPSESTFSRAFAEFAKMQLPSRIHESLIQESYAGELVGHISRDSTAIEGREKPVPKSSSKGQKPASKAPESILEEVRTILKEVKTDPEECAKAPRRLELQPTMELEDMLEDLPQDCKVGCKRNAQGHTNRWTGFKLHMDTADHGIPISCIVTSASLHDSQVAIPLSRMTQQRVTSLYDLMDSAYDAKELYEESRASGHVPIIDKNPRKKKAEHQREQTAQRHAGLVLPERLRYRERSTVERAFGRLKDEFGARNLRVRGYEKVTCHLMFGVLVLTVDQLLKLVQ
ncbi:MAG: transposase [Rhodothermaceae bacterium]|nr:transposase [Rhodothermaceae bacterium]